MTDKEAFICPISHMIFNDPVTYPDGITYEKLCIEEWLKNNNVSPVTK